MAAIYTEALELLINMILNFSANAIVNKENIIR